MVPPTCVHLFFTCACFFFFTSVSLAENTIPALPTGARLVLDEDWDQGEIVPERWTKMRKKWGQGNNGVVPENVRIDKDTVFGKKKYVLRCKAHGDLYDGSVTGHDDNKTRVGGVLYSNDFFASGRFEIVMKIGEKEKAPGLPENPMHPNGAVPAFWTYGYRFVSVDKAHKDDFDSRQPLYNPLMQRYGGACNEYWSELDFPEFGKDGDFSKGLYNTFLQNQHEPLIFDTISATDGEYHTLVTEWRTELQPFPDLKNDQVREQGGYFWICDKNVNFDRYYGNPLKKIDDNRYAVYRGKTASHWIDGRKVGENRRFVPAMAARLYLGVWLPDWGGPAPWENSDVKISSVKIWQYDDPGDVRGVLDGDHTSMQSESAEK